MRIHLHLGLPKTGTSSLQKTLLSLYGKAEPQSIWYPIPECMGDGHADMILRAAAFQGRLPEPDLLEQTAHRAARAGCQDLIISSECGAYTALSDQWPQLTALAKYGDVLPIVTFTPIGKRINSFWQEMAKNLVGLPMEQSRQVVADNLVELQLVTTLIEMFPDRVVSIIFMDALEDSGALYRRLAAVTGLALPEDALAGRNEVVNRSLCRFEADLMVALGESWRRRIGAENEFRVAQVRLLNLFSEPAWRANGPTTTIAFPHDWADLLDDHARMVITELKAFERSGRVTILGDIERFDDVGRPYKWPGIAIHRGAPMLAASIILIARSQGEALRLAVESALDQTITDLELLIVGEDCDEATRAVAQQLVCKDGRVRFLDLRGAGEGKAPRHHALGKARGRIVAHLDGYDLWLRNHLETLDWLLRDADFAHGLQVNLDKGGSISFTSCDLANPDLRQFMVATDHKRFDSTFVGYRLDAYRRLPGGWHTIAEDSKWPDVAMWQQFLAEPWCRARSATVLTGISLQTYLRLYLPEIGRAEEMARWRTRLKDPSFVANLQRQAVDFLNREAAALQMTQWRTEVQLRQQQAAAAQAVSDQQARSEEAVAAQQAETAARQAELEAAQQAIQTQTEKLVCARVEIAALRRRLSHEKARRARLKNALTWRLTRPFRRSARWLSAITRWGVSETTHR